jgi:hypothetical protein
MHLPFAAVHIPITRTAVVSVTGTKDLTVLVLCVHRWFIFYLPAPKTESWLSGCCFSKTLVPLPYPPQQPRSCLLPTTNHCNHDTTTTTTATTTHISLYHTLSSPLRSALSPSLPLLFIRSPRSSVHGRRSHRYEPLHPPIVIVVVNIRALLPNLAPSGRPA